jgi:hypothetical protein
MIKLQGYLRLGSELVANTVGLNILQGDGPPGSGIQFQPMAKGTIFAPAVYGTLGTAITTQDAAATIVPTFTSGDIAHLPPGSALTIAGTTTSSASASATSEGSYRLVTLTLVPISTPPQPSGSPSSTGGTVPASFYNVAFIVAEDTNGEYTAPSISSTNVTTTGSTSSITWTWTASTGPVSNYWILPCNTDFCTVNNTSTYFQVSASSACSGGTCTYTQTTPPSGGTTLPVNFSATGSHPRFIPMETLNVANCSDSTLDITGGAIIQVDYSASAYGQITYAQNTTTSGTTATGCSITSFDEDKYESARVVCSNGTPYTAGGFSNTCSTGQIVIYTNHPHSSSDLWGEVAVDPGYLGQGGFTMSDVDVIYCYGMCYWGEQASNEYIHNLGVNPSAYLAAGGIESTASWKSFYSQIYGETSGFNPGNCEAGGCSQPSYPYSLRCDSGSSVVALGNENGPGCAAFNIDGGAIIGGIKIDGGGRREIRAFPYEIEHELFEEAPNAGLVIDNRFGIDSSSCMSFNDNSLQDDLTGMAFYDIEYTNNESPSIGACYKLADLTNSLTNAYTNPYFNDPVIYDRTPPGVDFTVPLNNTATDGTWNDGVEMQAPVRGSGAGFGPQMLPFGSLPFDNNTSDWANGTYPAGCGGNVGCTIINTNVNCPDGPQATSKMQCAEVEGANNYGYIRLGSWTGSTYAGDQFIYGCYIRPGNNLSFPATPQNQDAFALFTGGTDAFTSNAFGGTTYTTPSYGFGTKLAYNSWYPLIAIATIASGEVTSHSIYFNINIPNGTTSFGNGNQISNCRWAFIPGPNNPSYAGVTPDQIAFARDNQYRGALPSNTNAGVAVTEENIQAAAATFTGEVTTSASTTSSAGLNLPQGTAPTSPVNGDLWSTSSGVYAQISGATVGPFGTEAYRTFVSYCIGTATASSTLYMYQLGAGATSCNVTSLNRFETVAMTETAGTVRLLGVRCGTTGAGPSSGVFTLYDVAAGGSTATSTDLTVTYGTTTANRLVQDTTHSYPYTAGDTFYLQFTTQASETLANCNVSFVY